MMLIEEKLAFVFLLYVAELYYAYLKFLTD
jgi:hypothetical protein